MSHNATKAGALMPAKTKKSHSANGYKEDSMRIDAAIRLHTAILKDDKQLKVDGTFPSVWSNHPFTCPVQTLLVGVKDTSLERRLMVAHKMAHLTFPEPAAVAVVPDIWAWSVLVLSDTMMKFCVFLKASTKMGPQSLLVKHRSSCAFGMNRRRQSAAETMWVHLCKTLSRMRLVNFLSSK